MIGDGDRAFLGANDYLERKLPHAHRTTVEGARHFVMRSHPESVADAVATVIAELGADTERTRPVPLPIDGALPSFTLRSTTSVSSSCRRRPAPARPRAPPSLIEQPWVGERKVLMLEPRRVAARAAATRMAEERGEQVGDTIGLRTRNDTRVSAITRVEVVTEGVLTRMLLDDPALEGYAVCSSTSSTNGRSHRHRPGLPPRDRGRPAPGSADRGHVGHLDAEALAARLRTDAVVKVEAERHPVTISYRPPEPGEDLTDAAAAAVVDAVGSDAHAGDLLVFLPGVGAITRVERSVRRPWQSSR